MSSPGSPKSPPGKTKRKARAPVVLLKQDEKQYVQKVLDDAVQLYHEAMVSNVPSTKVLPRNTIQAIFDKLNNPPWLNRQKLYYEIRKKRMYSCLTGKKTTDSPENIDDSDSQDQAFDSRPITEQNAFITPTNQSVASLAPIYNDENTITDLSTLANAADDMFQHENHEFISYDAAMDELNEFEDEYVDNDLAACNFTDNLRTINRNQGGRPKGSKKETTNVFKTIYDTTVTAASDEYKRVLDEKRIIDNVSKNPTRLPFGVLDNIIMECGKKYGLDEESISTIKKNTIRKRIRRDNTKGYAGSYHNTSPMAPVEPLLVAICIELNRCAKSIDMRQFLALANSIVKHKKLEQEVIRYKQIVCQVTETSTNLGRSYFRNFINRHAGKIRFCKTVKIDVKRKEWGTYSNVLKLYNLIYNHMVEENICRRLDAPVWRDREGKVVSDESLAYGLKSDIEMVNPDYLIFVDEVGSNTNMKNDKQIGKRRVIAEVGLAGQRQAFTSDIHYTVLGFTAGTGDPVMCVIIFTSSAKTIPTNWVTGINIGCLGEIDMAYVKDDIAFLEHASDAGVLQGGPVCFFGGKEVPTITFHSPHGGITSTILTECLREMDRRDLFPRINEKRPFLLLDGHGSRFDLEFLFYLRNNAWACCFGLPYATHLWQVGDHTQQNGRYKINEYDAKDILAQLKLRRNLRSVFSPTDIVPIVNYAWRRSFARSEGNKIAICECGWNPCNYAVLTLPQVLITKIQDEQTPLAIESTISPTILENNSIEINLVEGSAGMVANVIYKASQDKQFQAFCNNEDAMANRVKKAMDATRRVTSGPAFQRGMVALHKPGILEHQVTYMKFRKGEEKKKKVNRRAKLRKDKECADIIRMKDQGLWTVAEISKLLSYKRLKGDLTIKSANNDKSILLERWSTCEWRRSPMVSPISSDDEDEVVDNALFVEVRTSSSAEIDLSNQNNDENSPNINIDW